MRKLLLLVLLILSALAGCQKNTPGGTVPTTTLQATTPTYETSSATPASTTSGIAIEPKEFGWNDLVVDQIGYGTSEAEVLLLFGQPDEYEEYIEGATGNSFRVLHYNNKIILSLVETHELGFTLRDAKILSGGISGPRGLQVGDSMEKVLQSFRNEHQSDSILYSAGTTEITVSETVILPPRGYIAFEPDEDGRIEVHYDFPVTAYQTEEDKRSFVFLTHAMLMFKIKDDSVDEIRWSVSAMAE